MSVIDHDGRASQQGSLMMYAVYGRRLSALWRWRDRRPTHRGPLQPVIKTVITSAPTSIFSGSDVGDH
jgi:hypothetical protein